MAGVRKVINLAKCVVVAGFQITLVTKLASLEVQIVTIYSPIKSLLQENLSTSMCRSFPVRSVCWVALTVKSLASLNQHHDLHHEGSTQVWCVSDSAAFVTTTTLPLHKTPSKQQNPVAPGNLPANRCYGVTKQ